MKGEAGTVDPPQLLGEELKEILERTANAIRQLSMDAVEKANSGHPGLPLGCAEIGAYLFGVALTHNPKKPDWLGRDRFILSGGHGSMLLYSCLHLAGFGLEIEEIKRFRQLHSKTPGHPEEETVGVETTTGPLGQGVGNAVGQALGFKMLAARFNTERYPIINNKVYALMTDGCMMEGATSEVSALAGHWQLNNLIVIYDANKISLDGPLSEASSEETAARYRAYGWEVYEVDGHQLDALHEILARLKREQERPALVIAHTVIGKGAPHKAGSHKAHGAPLGEEEVHAAKEALGLPQEPFYVPQAVYDYFAAQRERGEEAEERWQKLLESWKEAHPDRWALFQQLTERKVPEGVEEMLGQLSIPDSIAGRKASHLVIQMLAKELPWLIGGSADLSCSDMTMIEGDPIIRAGDFSGRNIKFGVREFGMATIATGLAHTECFTPFIGTFLTFSDYMRNAIRLCALMREQVIYHFTHDSLFLGEDGPTHQPIEQLASLRAMPNLQVIRPADSNEVKMAWIAALTYEGPTAIVLSRQNLPKLEKTALPFAEGLAKGAYLLKREVGRADYLLVATGSEVALALDVAGALEKMGKGVRVISMPCWELFERQSHEYRESLFGGDIGKRVSIEAGSEMGWHRYIGREGIAIGIESFGASAPYRDLAQEFGFTVESILERIL